MVFLGLCSRIIDFVFLFCIFAWHHKLESSLPVGIDGIAACLETTVIVFYIELVVLFPKEIPRAVIHGCPGTYIIRLLCRSESCQTCILCLLPGVRAVLGKVVT